MHRSARRLDMRQSTCLSTSMQRTDRYTCTLRSRFNWLSQPIRQAHPTIWIREATHWMEWRDECFVANNTCILTSIVLWTSITEYDLLDRLNLSFLHVTSIALILKVSLQITWNVLEIPSSFSKAQSIFVWQYCLILGFGVSSDWLNKQRPRYSLTDEK